MDIKIIGSSGIWSKENSACYLIDNKILIDIPNGTCKELKRMGIEPMNLKYVLITHMHGDHYFDIPFLLLSKIKQLNVDKVTISTSRNGIKKIKKLTKLGFPNSIKKIKSKVEIKYETSKKFIIEDFKIEKVKVEHGKMKPSFGYIIQKDNLKVGFTGDSCYCESINYLASISNILICDCSLIKGNNKHMGIDNLIEISTKYPNCTIYASHLSDSSRDELQKLKNKNIIVSNDKTNIKLKSE